MENQIYLRKKEQKMKKLLTAGILASVIGTAAAMPTFHATAPVPTQHVHVHYDHFDRNTYIMGGAIIGIAAVMVVWAITDRYIDPTHYSVQF